MMRLAFAAAVAPVAVRSLGGNDYDPYNLPAPNCPQFTCPSGKKAVGKVNNQIFSYGRQDSLNMFNMASFDPANPYASAKPKSTQKCVVERDICKQTCGMPVKTCHDNFQKCTAKICKGDQNCKLQASMADIYAEPYVTDEEKYDHLNKCKGYNNAQAAACSCVPEAEAQAANENKLKEFYGKFNPEKLTKKGEIKDAKDVWKKWKGKEPEMFMALAQKYKDKAVDIRTAPKPAPWKPPADFEDPLKDSGLDKDLDEATKGWKDDLYSDGFRKDKEADATVADEPPVPVVSVVDEEWRAFEKKRVELDAKKKKAAADEEYELADQAKSEAKELAAKEVERLIARKKEFIKTEDYLEAKATKVRAEELKADFKLEL
jgi:hypothetical protein|eukprot:TRINITY_DN7820_c0_g1_i1.p1 TRINITY_DN7820_c0_g1~~TRINITY_DN7820_c0_g1_i1.p1  ORF type:complete len:375 (-),score=100.90 TRINITY_DN7820_c0_g1_i1:134-1258(-)